VENQLGGLRLNEGTRAGENDPRENGRESPHRCHASSRCGSPRRETIIGLAAACDVDQRFGASIPNIAPCGSSACAIHWPVGTRCGSSAILPPAPFTRATAASSASTLK